jgi:uncharacterized membrane protein YgcG
MKRIAIVVMLMAVSVVSLACSRGSEPLKASTNKQGLTKPAQGVAETAAGPLPVTTNGYVTDTANVIDGASRKQLERTLAALKQRKQVDFVIVTVPSTGNISARDYSLTLAREHKNNTTDKNVVSGLLLLVAVEDRNWHIQISRNLEDKLTDEVLTNLSEPMTDAFRQKHYGEGIIKYVQAVIEKLDNSH